jgi:hypothetical protein
MHTRDFAAAAASPDADRAVVDGATILGSMLAALLARPQLVADVRRAFTEPGGPAPGGGTDNL